MKIIVRGKEFETKQSIGICVAVIVIFALCGFIGYYAGNNAVLDEAVMNEVASARKQSDEELLSIEQKISDAQKALEEKNEIIKSADDYAAKKEQLDKDYQTKSLELDSLNAQITSKQAELDTLTGNIVKAKSEPKTLSAGEFTVGGDLPSGRYNVSGSSNFVVYSSSGTLKVNTILGESRVGKGDYVCTLVSGDKMKLSARTTFTPIE